MPFMCRLKLDLESAQWNKPQFEEDLLQEWKSVVQKRQFHFNPYFNQVLASRGHFLGASNHTINFLIGIVPDLFQVQYTGFDGIFLL